MATLERIRSKGLLLMIVIGFALVAFLFTGLDTSLTGKSKEDVVEINGEVIKIQDYQALQKQLEEVYKIEYSRSSLDENIMLQVRQTVWTNVVKDNILQSEAEKLGLVVGQKEFEDLTIGDNPHQLVLGRRVFMDPNTGMFDKKRMLGFLAQLDSNPANAQEQEQLNSLKNYWMYFEKVIKNSELENKYNTLLSKALNVNKVEAEMAYKSNRNTVDYLYTFKSYATIADEKVKVTDAEITAKYNEIKERYKQENTRDVKYVAFSLSPSKADFAKSEEWITKLKADFSTTTDITSVVNPNSLPYKDIALSAKDIDPDLKAFAFSGNKNDVLGPVLFGNTYKMARIMETGISAPDSIKLKHIIVMAEDEAKTEELADSIMDALKGGAAFAPLAMKYSKMQETAMRGGEVGWVPVASAENGIINACIAQPTNKYFTYKDGGSIQVLQVTEKTAYRSKVKLAVISNEVKPSQDTYSNIYNEAKQFAANNNTLSAFEKGAEKSAYVVLPALALEENTPSIMGLENSREIIRWSFKAEESGVVSDVYDCEDKFVVAAVAGVYSKGYKELETVKEEIKSMLIPEKKAAMIIADIDSKKSKDIKVLAAQLGLKVDTVKQVNFDGSSFGSHGYEPAVIANASVVELNKISKPVRGNQGVYVLQAYNIFANPTPFDEKRDKRVIEMSYSNIAYGSINTLKEKMDIVDNRSKFY